MTWLYAVPSLILLILVCAGTGIIIGLEYYYSKGTDKGLLARRFAIASRNQTIAAVIGLAVLALTRLL